MIYDLIRQLVEYGLDCGLVQPEDTIYTANRLFALFKLDGDDAAIPAHTGQETPRGHQLEPLLAALLDWAYDHGLLEGNSVDYRDILDTAIMGCLTPPPSQVNATFKALYQKSPQAATDWFYEFSQNSDYIRRYRIQRDMKWTVATEYGELDITINLSKPEKDPKAIAAAKLQPQGGYPKCQLCVENEGYSGRLNHPARSSHRIIPVIIDGQEWGFQYSPYVYYNEHCILLNKSHVPMEINKAAFGKLFDFVRQFPHYMVGSNADLPIVGGSILSHEHFQGGNYTFPMARATVETSFQMSRFPQVEAGILKWPMSVIRLRHQDYNILVEAALVELKEYLNNRKIMSFTMDPPVILSIKNYKGQLKEDSTGVDKKLDAILHGGDILKANQYAANIRELIMRKTKFEYRGENLYFEGILPRWYAFTNLPINAKTLLSKIDKRSRNKLRKAAKLGIEILRDETQNVEYIYNIAKENFRRPI